MCIVSLKVDFAFQEFMSNETVRKFFLVATLDFNLTQDDAMTERRKKLTFSLILCILMI